MMIVKSLHPYIQDKHNIELFESYVTIKLIAFKEYSIFLNLI